MKKLHRTDSEFDRTYFLLINSMSTFAKKGYTYSTFLVHSFYLLYLLLNSYGGNDLFWRHSMLVKHSRSDFIFLDLQSPSNPDYTEFGNWCRNVCTRHPSVTPATWSSASLTHGQAYHKTSLTKQLVNGESGLCVCVKAKWHHFKHILHYLRGNAIPAGHVQNP